MPRARPLLALLAGLAAALLPGAAGAEVRILDRVVAVVDEEALFASELRERAAPFLRRLEREIEDPVQRAAATAEVYRELLGRMVDGALVARAAAAMRVSVTPAEIDGALRQIAAQSQATPEQIVAQVAEQGLSERAYRDELRRQILEAKALQLWMSQRRIQLSGLDPADRQQRVEAARRAWLEALRREVHIEVRL